MDDGQLPGAPPAAPTAETTPPVWRIARASIELIMDIIEISRGSGHLVDPLIVSTVIEGNLAVFNQDAELQRAYADVDHPPPDELRRPVSIAAVAASLSLPYETVRRRANQLVGTGALVATGKGLIVPAAALTRPAYLAEAARRYARVRRFYFEMKAMGATAGLPQPDTAAPLAAAPIRLVNRAIGEFMMRTHEQLLKRLGDPVSGLVLLDLGRAGAEHLDARARQVEAPLPDHLRQPVSVLRLAQRLRLPAETVRRHVGHLEAKGLARRVAGGWVAEIATLPRLDPGGPPIARNLSNVRRLLARLAAFGVIAFWEAEGESA